MRDERATDTVRGPQPPGSVATVGGLLRGGTERLRQASSETPRLDAELLLGHVLRVGRTTILAHPEASVGPRPTAAFAACLARRMSGEPVAYIRGFKEFYGLAFSADPRALIPRPETERLVELAERMVRAVLSGARRPAGARPFRIWDVGTGSGAIAVALAVRLRRLHYGDALQLFASDRSGDALDLAIENAVGHGVADAITFGTGDLFEVAGMPESVDLVVSNPPYIPSEVVPTLPIAASFEPRESLDGGPDGLDVVRRLLPGLPKVLTHEGEGLIEIGSDQADAARAAAAQALPGWPSAVHADLAGRPRVLQVARRAEGHVGRQAEGHVDRP